MINLPSAIDTARAQVAQWFGDGTPPEDSGFLRGLSGPAFPIAAPLVEEGAVVMGAEVGVGEIGTAYEIGVGLELGGLTLSGWLAVAVAGLAALPLLLKPEPEEGSAEWAEMHPRLAQLAQQHKQPVHQGPGAPNIVDAPPPWGTRELPMIPATPVGDIDRAVASIPAANESKSEATDEAAPPADDQSSKEPSDDEQKAEASARHGMRPLSEWPPQERQQVQFLIHDVDGTVSDGGKVDDAVIEAMRDLAGIGVKVIPNTGARAGKCARFVVEWPVAAVIAENGALAFVPCDGGGPPKKLYRQTAEQRKEQFDRMTAVMQKITEEMPELIPSVDNKGRETDIAVKGAMTLKPETIKRVLQIMQDANMRTTQGSHLHGTYNDGDKLSGMRWLLRELYGVNLDDVLPQVAYVGDAENDAVAFAAVKQSFGVANIQQNKKPLSAWPTYITPSPIGAGFIEVAQSILSSR